MGLIYELEVAEHSRRRGTGRSLVQEALRLMTEAGAIAVWLTTGRANTPARELYRSMDAEEIDDILYQWRLMVASQKSVPPSMLINGPVWPGSTSVSR